MRSGTILATIATVKQSRGISRWIQFATHEGLVDQGIDQARPRKKRVSQPQRHPPICLRLFYDGDRFQTYLYR